MYMHTYKYINIYICICVYICIPTHTQTHSHTLTHIYIYTYIERYVWLNKTDTISAYCISDHVFVWIIWHVNGTNSKRRHIFHKYFQSHQEPSLEEQTFEMTNKMTSCMHLSKELEEEQVGREFTKENCTEGKRKNWREKCWRLFRTWLRY